MAIKKITQLYRAGWMLGTKVLLIYLKKVLGRSQNADESALIGYYNLLVHCKLRHVGTFDQGYIFRTADNALLHARVPPSSDFAVLRQIWRDQEYGIVVDAIQKHLKKGPLRIMDAGANIGYSTAYLIHRLQKLYTPFVVCIEPGDENIRVLKRNVQINHFKNIEVEQAGLFNKPCFLKINTGFRDGKDWSLQVEESATATDLKAVEVSQLMEKNGWQQIDFLKIDIEGAERYLFADKAYARSFLRKVRMISIEIHNEYGIEDHILQILKDNHFSYTQSGEITLGLNTLLLGRKDN